MTIAWEINNARSNGFLLTIPGPVEFKLRALPRPDQDTADHAFATWVRALDAAMHKMRPHPANASCFQPVAIRPRMADGRLSLRWIELGGPTVTPPTRRGFGTRIMENIIAQLNGEVRFDWRGQGLGCEIALLLA